MEVLLRGQLSRSLYLDNGARPVDWVGTILPDRAAVVLFGRDGFQVRDVLTGRIIREVKAPLAFVSNDTMELSKDGKTVVRIAQLGRESRTTAWDLTTGEKISDFIVTRRSQFDGEIEWSPDAPVLTSNGAWMMEENYFGKSVWSPDARVRLYESTMWRNHPLGFHGRFLVNSITHLWDARAGRPIARVSPVS